MTLGSDMLQHCQVAGASMLHCEGSTEGLVESLGITAILESAYKKAQAQSGDGCKAVAIILDGEVQQGCLWLAVITVVITTTLGSCYKNRK